MTCLAWDGSACCLQPAPPGHRSPLLQALEEKKSDEAEISRNLKLWCGGNIYRFCCCWLQVMRFTISSGTLGVTPAPLFTKSIWGLGSEALSLCAKWDHHFIPVYGSSPGIVQCWCSLHRQDPSTLLLMVPCSLLVLQGPASPVASPRAWWHLSKAWRDAAAAPGVSRGRLQYQQWAPGAAADCGTGLLLRARAGALGWAGEAKGWGNPKVS